MKKQVAIIHANPDHAGITLIDWSLGNVCNYRCSYCPRDLHDGSLKWPDANKVIALAAKIVSHYRSLGRKALFDFTGGEPSAYKGMLEVLGALKQSGALTAMTSNGGRDLAWWERAIPHLDGIVLTWHVEFAEMDHFAAVTNRLLEAGVRTHLDVPMIPERFEECAANASELAARCKGASIGLKPLLVAFGAMMYPYSEHQKKMMREFSARPSKQNSYRGDLRCIYDDGSSELLGPRDLLLREENRWESWNCNAGMESIAIKADGSIYRAVRRQDGPIGNLYDQSIAFPAAPVRCGRETCHCLSDMRITRWRNGYPIETIAKPPPSNPA